MNPRRRTTLTTALAALLVVGAAGGGLAYTKITVDGADRTAPTRAWKESKQDRFADSEEERFRGRQDTALSKELLPLPDGFGFGPDIGTLGNDVSLSGRKAEALLAEERSWLPAAVGEAHRKLVDELGVQGIAMRSYARSRPSNLMIEIRLAQMHDRGAVEERNAARAGLAEALSGLRKGPKIDGYENATCFLLPESDVDGAISVDGATGVEEMFCSAYEDDTLVSLTAAGSAPLAKEEAAKLLEKQLDRLTKGGGISA